MQARMIRRLFKDEAAVSVKRTPQFHTCALHGHGFYELDIVIGGSAPSTLNGNLYTACAGTVFFLTPEDLHDYPTAEKIDILNIQFQGCAVSNAVLRALIDSKCRSFVLESAAFRSVCDVFPLIEEQLNAVRPNAEILARLLEVILLTLQKEGVAVVGTEHKNVADMSRALTYLHEHFMKNPTLGEVAAVLSLNERYFCAKFKEHTGQRYKDYLRERKLAYAKLLLHSTSLSVTEIAFESGYDTTSHFNREFKAYFGTTPLSVRKEKQP